MKRTKEMQTSSPEAQLLFKQAMGKDEGKRDSALAKIIEDGYDKEPRVISWLKRVLLYKKYLEIKDKNVGTQVNGT